MKSKIIYIKGKTKIKEVIDPSYNLPTSYEEVLSYNKTNGYTCIEKIKE